MQLDDIKACTGVRQVKEAILQCEANHAFCWRCRQVEIQEEEEVEEFQLIEKLQQLGINQGNSSATFLQM